MESVKINDVYEELDRLYPFETQMSFDNAGFLIGDGSNPVSNILIALDITSQVIQEAIDLGCQLIITHHPIIFTPLKTLLRENPTERMIIQLIQHNIAVISAHTNLDRAQEGVNYHLAQALELQEIAFVLEEGVDRFQRPYGTGYYGNPPTGQWTGESFAGFVEKSLGSKGLRFVDGGKPVSRVAVGGGACSSILPTVAKLGCDTFVTGDVKYDVFLDAKERGITLIDAGHFPTEQVICQPMQQKLQEKFSSLTITLSYIHQEVSAGTVKSN